MKLQKVVLWTLWTVMLSTYLVFAFIVTLHFREVSSASFPDLLFPVLVLSTIMGALALVMQFLIWSSEQWKKQIIRYKNQQFQKNEIELRMTQQLETYSALSWAFPETLSILGMVLVITGNISFLHFYIFLTIGLCLHLLAWPKFTLLKKSLAQAFPG